MMQALTLLQFILAVLLIISVALQTTKGGGLGSALGGGQDTTYKARKGVEETVDRITAVLALGFLGCSLLLSILT